MQLGRWWIVRRNANKQQTETRLLLPAASLLVRLSLSVSFCFCLSVLSLSLAVSVSPTACLFVYLSYAIRDGLVQNEMDAKRAKAHPMRADCKGYICTI